MIEIKFTADSSRNSAGKGTGRDGGGGGRWGRGGAGNCQIIYCIRKIEFDDKNSSKTNLREKEIEQDKKYLSKKTVKLKFEQRKDSPALLS